MADQQTHYRLQLNNYLLQNGGTQRLTWEDFPEGPQDRPLWTAIAYLDRIQYGRGSGGSRGAAREEAARRVLAAINIDAFRSRAANRWY